MLYGEKSLLRFSTTGSVDDGKSTLIGRLLYETKSIYEDQYAGVERASLRKGLKDVELAYLLDGLAAEREQGITIDVAYRYFETPKRKFIIADTPGHVQYTRNMITGVSRSDCAIILIDARNGVQIQSKRHGLILSLLQIPHLMVAVNKMDLVDYSETSFANIVAEFENFSQKLDIQDITYIPVSALKGDNIVEKSRKMPWYDGSSLLHCLESAHVTGNRNLVDFRFPVQYVIRPHQDFRGFAGKVISGTIAPGEEIVVLPSRDRARIETIATFDGELSEAFAQQSVALELDREIDVSRGDMIVRKKNIPQADTHLDATICWMDEEASSKATSFILKHTTRNVRAYIRKIIYKIDVNTLHREQADSFLLNEIGRVEIDTASPIFFDPYRLNHATGSFILIDPLTNKTVAAGMIRNTSREINNDTDDSSSTNGLVTGFNEPGKAVESSDSRKASKVPVTPVLKSSNLIWSDLNIPREAREKRNSHPAAVLWFTGYSGAGKSTIAKLLEKKLFDSGHQTMLLDGDNLRHGLCRDLGFSEQDRNENIRRAGEVARLFFEAGHVVLCSFISPFVKDRKLVRSLFPETSFFEIHVKCSLETCIKRDPNGLYKKALTGQISEFTGVSSPYEPPPNPEIVVKTDVQSPEQIIEALWSLLSSSKSIRT
ncbi:MAG: sulfate adenylyltransferase subunit CysN [Candidatus Riflebacteria bacterium]|nr:sulfate adenylyltransferase subunit CysN [Candidatus Riflebacteria bacterium]